MQIIKSNNTLIIIPVFNEEEGIVKVIDDLRNRYKEVDILVVNDGSFDKTKEAVKGRDVFLIDQMFNLGIGASLQTGCQFALDYGYDYIVRIDGDGQHDSNFIKDILSPVKSNDVDIAVGSRFLGKSEFKSSFFRLIGIKIISLVLGLITGKTVTDPTSGFCAMNKKAYSFFAANCIEDYPEPEILIHHRNFRIREVPISISKRFSGVSSISPLKSIYYMYKVLFSLFVSVFRKEMIR